MQKLKDILEKVKGQNSKVEKGSIDLELKIKINNLEDEVERGKERIEQVNKEK